MSKLAETLSHLLRYAEEHPGEKQSTRLENGLAIDILVDHGPEGSTHLQIHRAGVFPSSTEWATVLRHWPYAIKAGAKQTRFKDRCYLISAWPTPARLIGSDVCAQTQEED